MLSNRGSAARHRAGRAGFALRDLLACIVCLSMLGMLGCMWLNRPREESYRRGCLSTIRQLALGVANYEGATKRFPVVSDAETPLHRIAPGTVGSDKTNSSGYSWLVHLLPFMEERILYDQIADTTGKFSTRPFHADVAGSDGTHFSARQLYAYRCPTYSGDDVASSRQFCEYDDLAVLSHGPAISNYVAIVGTHATADGPIKENGVIVSRCATAPETCDGKGLRLKDLGDGISHTMIICETREPVYAAWFDGQATWVVGVEPTGAGDVQDDGQPGAAETLLNRSPYSTIGLPNSWPGRVEREWGASSEHSGGVVLHAFADAHAAAISEDIDPSVYYRLITRNGGEPINVDEL